MSDDPTDTPAEPVPPPEEPPAPEPPPPPPPRLTHREMAIGLWCVYREELGRLPDEEGAASYAEWADLNAYDCTEAFKAAIRADIRTSEEWRKLHEPPPIPDPPPGPPAEHYIMRPERRACWVAVVKRMAEAQR